MDTQLFNQLKGDERFKDLPNKSLLDILDFVNETAPEFKDAAATAITKPELTLMDHLDKIVELSKNRFLGETFFKTAGLHLKAAGEILQLNERQTALFAHFLKMGADGSTFTLGELADSLGCNNMQLVKYMDDFEELDRKKLVCYSRERREEYSNNMRKPHYRVTQNVVKAIRNGCGVIIESHKNLSLSAMFEVIREYFIQYTEMERSFESLEVDLKELITDNMQLEFCQKIKDRNLWDMENLVVFLRFCELYILDEDDFISMNNLRDVMPRVMARHIEQQLKKNIHWLNMAKLVEHAFDKGMGEREYFHLTEEAKTVFLEGIDFAVKKNYRDIIDFNNLLEKKMFYNDAEASQMAELTNLLGKDNFASVQQRLASSGMRKGFACLFYGGPGTGKTESVYQLARATGRSIMMVDIAQTKSCWYGESEKLIKRIFDRYARLVKASKITPILLFNEADAIISTRREFDGRGGTVDQTENAIQNIILQEMEKLDGILIATTNLTTNLDKAFERRFLYKIEFKKPSAGLRGQLWRSIIPDLTAREAKMLAERYDFSGGQMENIVRKRTVNNIICGRKPSFKEIDNYCSQELINNDGNKQVGFV